MQQYTTARRSLFLDQHTIPRRTVTIDLTEPYPQLMSSLDPTRLKTRIDEIVRTASEVQQMLRSASVDANCVPTDHRRDDVVSRRDPEVSEILDMIVNAHQETSSLRGQARDTALAWIERVAAPFALVLYEEVLRLDALLTSSTLADRSAPVADK
jgi:hypothetical protein